MILDDPGLEGVGAVLFDEFHERSLDADLGLALARDSQSVLRDDLKLVVTLHGTDITKSPRFAVVPVLNYNSGQQFGSKWWAVLEMKPVYLQSTWYECTGGKDKECLFQPADFMSDPADRDTYSVLFNPGEAPAAAGPCYLSGTNCATPQSSKFQLMGMSALVLDWSQLPGAKNQLGGNAPFEAFLHPNE